MALTDIEIRGAKPDDRLIKLSDGGGLQLWITPDGAKRWRLAYRFGGAQKLLAIGVYPATSLRDARKARDEAKRLLAKGQDPSLANKRAKAAQVAALANTFDAIGAELLEKKRKEAKADRTLSKLEWLLSLASPAIGARPITEITAPEIEPQATTYALLRLNKQGQEHAMSSMPAQGPVLGDKRCCDALDLIIVPRVRNLGGGKEPG